MSLPCGLQPSKVACQISHTSINNPLFSCGFIFNATCHRWSIMATPKTLLLFSFWIVGKILQRRYAYYHLSWYIFPENTVLLHAIIQVEALWELFFFSNYKRQKLEYLEMFIWSTDPTNAWIIVNQLNLINVLYMFSWFVFFLWILKSFFFFFSRVGFILSSLQ